MTRRGAFYAPGSRHELALASEWGRLQQSRSGAVSLGTPPAAIPDADASALEHKAEKPDMTIFVEFRAYPGLAINACVLELSCDDPNHQAQLAAAGKCLKQPFSGKWFSLPPHRTGIPSAAQELLGLKQSRLVSTSKCPITNNTQ